MSKAKSKYLKFELEFPIHASRNSLYNFFSTAGGLSMWFADSCFVMGDDYRFKWDKSEQVARLVSQKENQYARYKWTHEPDYTFFEFRIEVDELTGDVALVVTDWAEDVSSMENAKMLWTSQIDNLHHALGAL
jgi:hypothetical protein